MYYKVAAGCSVLLKNNVIRATGETLQPNELSRQAAADLVRSKHLIRFDDSPAPIAAPAPVAPVVKTTEQFSTKAEVPPQNAPERVEQIPGVVPPPVMKVENNTPAPGDPNMLSNSTAEAVKTQVVSAPPPPNPTQPAAVMDSKWSFSPLNLTRLNLEQLNAMIIERDGSVKPFDTKEEAIAMLSQDFKE